LFSLGARRLPIEANRFEANWGDKLRELRGGEPHAHAAREDRGLMVKIPW